MRRLHSEMTPFPLLRSGQDYHNTDIIPDAFSSASAIRHSYEKASSLEKCADAMPDEVYELLAGHPDRFGISLSDFDLLLYYALRRACRNGTLTGYGDISTELANRIEKELASYKDADSFILSLKRKNITYARDQPLSVPAAARDSKHCLQWYDAAGSVSASARHAPFQEQLSAPHHRSSDHHKACKCVGSGGILFLFHAPRII